MRNLIQIVEGVDHDRSGPEYTVAEDFRIRVYNKDFGDVAFDEKVRCTPFEAEKKLSALWNEHCAHLPDRGWRGTIHRPGQRAAWFRMS